MSRPRPALKHLYHVQSAGIELPESFVVRTTGRYYTHHCVAAQMASSAIRAWSCAGPGSTHATLCIADPFAGDGRLVLEFIRAWMRVGCEPVKWSVTLWDLNEEGLSKADTALSRLRGDTGLDLKWDLTVGDSFHLASMRPAAFDVVISNPPWELLKPDRRELKQLPSELAAAYVCAMREYDDFLAEAYPVAQPSRKFAGWGTNLSRVGYDACRTVLKSDGVLAIVMPASFMADDLSLELRRDVLERSTVHEIAYYPAEARLFGSADIASITLAVEPKKASGVEPIVTRFTKDLDVLSRRQVALSHSFLEQSGFVVPVSVGGDAIAVLQRLMTDLPTWSELEGLDRFALWAGREVDETGSTRWLSPSANGPLFMKGRMVDRLRIKEEPRERVGKPGWTAPSSVNFTRIVWRDVSRPSQKRRVVATLVPPGTAAGNSLGVAYFKDGNERALHVLLGVMSSLVFEFQLRSYLATGHVSLSALRKVHVPSRLQLDTFMSIAEEVEALLADSARSHARLEALVAYDAFALSEAEVTAVVRSFKDLSSDESCAIVSEFQKLMRKRRDGAPHDRSNVLVTAPGHAEHEIPNHVSARLSALDQRMVEAVPEGGNWKNIPKSIPSKRLEQIRDSFARGEGSRSTYYGRLRSNMPSYTINTYFNRPGNGCHIHPRQDRVLSQREAARLQSFPDDFRFLGPQGRVNEQIGNSVPPLLAYQIARSLGEPGVFVDLFSGAGGMGLGFMWAGWTPLLANDIEARYLETYRLNVHCNTILGSITDPAIRDECVLKTRTLRSAYPRKPLWILGGPPCQGFSTAGRKRTMQDERNHLFRDYCRVLKSLQPDGFVFENVTGLLNMQNGRVFQVVREAFGAVMDRVDGWILSAEEYAVPQRRRRVVLIGTADTEQVVSPLQKLTSCDANGELFSENRQAVSVDEALSDLPLVEPGQDGTRLPYASDPRTTYQALMRGLVTPDEFLDSIRRGQRRFQASK